MKRSKILLVFIIFLSIPIALAADEFQVKIIESKSDLPENFCPIWSQGDYLITDGSYLVLIGGKSRRLYSNNNYYVADALGSLVGMVPVMTVIPLRSSVPTTRSFLVSTRASPNFFGCPCTSRP